MPSALGQVASAIGSFGQGFLSAREQRRLEQRQAEQDALKQAQVESENRRRDQQDRSQAAQNALQRTLQTMQAGLRPDRGEPFLGEDVTRTEGGDTGLAGSNSPLMLAARAIQNAKGADRYTLLTESGGQETYRRVPGASKEEQEQAAAQKRLDDQQAAAEALAAQRAKDEHDRAIELEMLRQQGVIKPGSPEWKQMEIDRARIGAQYGYHPPRETMTSIKDAQGNDVTGVVNLDTKQFTPIGGKTTSAGGALAAPMAAKVGQAGEMLKKADDLFQIMDGMNVSLGQSTSRDIAEHGIGVGHLRIPGTKGLGNAMMNNAPAYAQYQASLSPFILAAAHALSGARINQDQVEQIRKSIELAPGDFGNENVVRQKHKNIIDLVNSITGSLPKDAMQAQEAQMEPEAIERVRSRGYRVRSGEQGTAPKGKTVTVNGKTFKID